MKTKIGLIISAIIQLTIVLIALRFSGHIDSLSILSFGLMILMLIQLLILGLFVIFKLLTLKRFGLFIGINLLILGFYYTFHKSYDYKSQPKVLLWGLNGENNLKLADLIDKSQIDSILLIDFNLIKPDTNSLTNSSHIIRISISDSFFVNRFLQSKTFKPVIYKYIPTCCIRIYSKHNKIDELRFTGYRMFKFDNQFFLTDTKMIDNYIHKK